MPANTPSGLDKREFVLAKCRYFVDAQVWPAQTLFPEQWLDNFTAAESPYAVHLLNHFLFFSDHLVDSLLFGGLMDLSRRIIDLDRSASESRARWAEFLDLVLVTYPSGEDPGPTDSGYMFARKARQKLGFSPQQICAPADAIKRILEGGPVPVLFLDDFLGTGQQFITSWTRRERVDGIELSLAQLQTQVDFPAYYAPLFATATGIRDLESVVGNVTFAPTHALAAPYSALHPDSYLWPAAEVDRGREVIAEASLRAGIPDTDGIAERDWQGFGKLGLCIGFEHGVPDATLPLFYWDQNDWNPLVRRK
jgi:hypothetical protein